MKNFVIESSPGIDGGNWYRFVSLEDNKLGNWFNKKNSSENQAELYFKCKQAVKKEDKMKIYEIEDKGEIIKNYANYIEIHNKYRFISLYNGARGTWFDTIEAAERQGAQHQKIVEMIHSTPPFIHY